VWATAYTGLACKKDNVGAQYLVIPKPLRMAFSLAPEGILLMNLPDKYGIL
jgi:hypothetical protein